jgi:hypothetical protein
LHVEQNHSILAAAQERAGAGVEDGVRGAVGRGALLRDLVFEVFHQDLVVALVEDGESVSRDEHRRRARASAAVARSLAADAAFR